MLEKQLQYQESQNAIAKDLRESQERYKEPEQKIAFLMKTGYDLEKRTRSVDWFNVVDLTRHDALRVDGGLVNLSQAYIE